MLTVSQALKFYWIEHVAEKVLDKSRRDYAIANIEEILGDDLTKDIHILRSREYRRERIAEGAKDSTIRYELSLLQTAAQHCVKWQHLDAKDMPVIELPQGSEPRIIWIYKDELQELVKSATGRALWFILLAYYTAGRKRSVESLERRQVDLEMRRINLHKKGAPKTKKRKPIVPIDPHIYDRLVTLLESHNSKWVLESDADVRWEFNKAAEAAGLLDLPERGLREAGRLTPHVLRHTRATHLLQDGKSPFAVANLLGDNLMTVLRVYGHACPDFMAEAIA